MTDNIFGPGRRSIRLKGFDYKSVAAYFVTICVQDRLPLFGNISNGQMNLSPAGEMIDHAWKNLALEHQHILIDETMVMPDHLHGIVFIEPVEYERHVTQSDGPSGQAQGLPLRSYRPISLPDLIGGFKSSTTVQYIKGVEQHGWPGFRKRLWQRNYYEHIIRNEEDLNRVREYIRDNPANWQSDSGNTHGRDI
jgi:putative transposase